LLGCLGTFGLSEGIVVSSKFLTSPNFSRNTEEKYSWRAVATLEWLSK
jgi:hypothetical protein